MIAVGLGLGLLRGVLITGYIADAAPASHFDARPQTALAALQSSKGPH